MVLGTPDRITAYGPLGSTGVDEHIAVLSGYDSDGVTLAQKTSVCPLPARANGDDTAGGSLHHQMRHVHKRLIAGELESDIMPLDETVAVMRTLDTARDRISAP
jgi:hypothetical protein